MLATTNGIWLKSEARQFVNDQGQTVDYYRASILDDDMEPQTLGCTQEVHDFAQRELSQLQPVQFVLNIRRNNNGLRVRIENVIEA